MEINLAKRDIMPVNKCDQQWTDMLLISLDRNNNNNVLYAVKSQVKFVIKFWLKGTKGRNGEKSSRLENNIGK